MYFNRSQSKLRWNERIQHAIHNILLHNDDVVVEQIRKLIIRPSTPPDSAAPRSSGDGLKDKHFSQEGQSQFVDERLHRRRNGFFVECGIYNGKVLSNTLFIERYRNWTGLLVVEDTGRHSALLKCGRRAAQVVPVCLSPSAPSGVAALQNARLSGYTLRCPSRVSARQQLQSGSHRPLLSAQRNPDGDGRHDN